MQVDLSLPKVNPVGQAQVKSSLVDFKQRWEQLFFVPEHGEMTKNEKCHMFYQLSLT